MSRTSARTIRPRCLRRAVRRARRLNPLDFEFELPKLGDDDVRQGF